MALKDLEKVREKTYFKSGKKQVALATKAGKSKSQKKSVSAKIRYMREQGYNDKKMEEILQSLDNPEFSILEIRKYVDKLKTMVNTPQEFNMVINHYEHLHKLHHGEKKNINVKSINLNVNASEAMTEKFLHDIEEHFSE